MMRSRAELPRYQVIAKGLVGKTAYNRTTVEKAEEAVSILRKRPGIITVSILDRVTNTTIITVYGGILR